MGPGEHDALVLDDVKEIARVVLVAERKRTSFMGLNKGILACEVHMGVLIEQRVEHPCWRCGKFDDLINVLRTEFHDAAVLRLK